MTDGFVLAASLPVMADPWNSEPGPAPSNDAPAGFDDQNANAAEDTIVDAKVSTEKWTALEVTDYTAPPPSSQAQTWDSNARTYEWNDEYGEVGPKFPELEIELFGEEATRHERTGLDFSK